MSWVASVRGDWFDQDQGEAGQPHCQKTPVGWVFNQDAVTLVEEGAWLSRIGVGMVWRVGPRLSRRYNDMGIHTVAYLQAADPIYTR